MRCAMPWSGRRSRRRRCCRSASASPERSYWIAVATGLMSALAALAAAAALLLLLRRYLLDRQAVTAELTARAELLKITLASIGDGVITTDTDGRVTNMNPVAEKMTGWPAAEAEGQPLEAVFRIVNEETRAPLANPAARALSEERDRRPGQPHAADRPAWRRASDRRQRGADPRPRRQHRRLRARVPRHQREKAGRVGTARCRGPGARCADADGNAGAALCRGRRDAARQPGLRRAHRLQP